MILGHLVKAASVLMVLELVSQVAALVKQVIVAAQFGTSAAMDAYLVAFAIAALLRVWVSLPIKQTVIPMFRHDLAREGEQVAWRHLSMLLNNMAVVLLVVALVAGFAAPVLVDLVAPGLADPSEVQAATLVRIMIVTVIFIGLQGVLGQILFSYRRFVLPGLAGSAESLVAIAVLLVLGGRYGVYGLAIALVVGAVTQFALQVPVLWQKRTLYTFTLDLRHPRMREMAGLSLPLLLTAGGTELARITDRIFASLLAAGGLSALAFAHRLSSAGNNLFIDSIQQATFPHFAQLTAEGKFGTLSRQLFRYLRMILFLAVPVAGGMLLLSDLIVRVVYQRGAFDESAVALTGTALAFYAIGLPAVSVARLLNRTFFGLKDTRTPAKLALGRLALKVVLCAVFIGPLAHGGIALADSLSEIVRAGLLFAALPVDVRRDEGRETLRSLARTMAAASVMMAAVFAARASLAGALAAPLELAVLSGVGIAVYGAMTLAFRAEERDSLFKIAGVLGIRFLPSKG